MEYKNDVDILTLEGFDWDKGNLNKNRLKHNVEPSECEEVCFNKPIIILDDQKHSGREKRYKIIGISSSGRKLSLAITIRNNKIRVIMARDQSRGERKLFEAEPKR